ncbi:MAG: hypothetical protein JW809_13060 [Pirellulales bacterium]|nr:hypothetical protein [Pirellulales bacterium]
MAVLVLGCLCLAQMAQAQQPEVHYLHQGVMPPGAIGGLQLQRGGPLHGFFQPVEIKAPTGASVSLASDGQFQPSAPAPLRVGLLIGQVYRLRVTNIPLAPGLEVFPTIEVIDRLYAPADQTWRFAIAIELTAEDLRLAADGKFVTRVIYLEDPFRAVPIAEDTHGQPWFEAKPGDDPLAVADGLGRPVAILRIGARVPESGQGSDEQFLFGCPPFEADPIPPALPAPPSGAAAPPCPAPTGEVAKRLPPPPAPRRLRVVAE